MTLLPTTNNTPSVISIFNPARPSAAHRLPSPPFPDNAGIRIISGTTAISCINNTPITIWPCVCPNSVFSDKIRLTIAVDDIANAPDTANAQLNGTPVSIRMPITDSIVIPTCKPPSPNTSRLIALSLGSENSKPILNIKNTIPISPK